MTLWAVSYAGQVVTGVVLLVAIIKIKIFISSSGFARMVNNCVFALHFAVFSAYMLVLALKFKKILQYKTVSVAG